MYHKFQTVLCCDAQIDETRTHKNLNYTARYAIIPYHNCVGLCEKTLIRCFIIMKKYVSFFLVHVYNFFSFGVFLFFFYYDRTVPFFSPNYLFLHTHTRNDCQHQGKIFSKGGCLSVNFFLSSFVFHCCQNSWFCLFTCGIHKTHLYAVYCCINGFSFCIY